MRGIVLGILLIAPACATPEDLTADRVFDPCAPLAIAVAADADADQRAGITDALALWEAVLDLRATDDADAQIAIRFEPAAPLFHGVYLDEIGEIVINTDLPDSYARAVTIAHELGHAFGLLHVEDRPSVMASGNLDVAPTPDDASAVASLWPSCE